MAGEWGVGTNVHFSVQNLIQTARDSPWGAVFNFKPTVSVVTLFLKDVGVRRIPWRFGMLASEFTQCQYLTTENSIRCHLSSFSCDPSSREICAFGSRARDRTVRFL